MQYKENIWFVFEAICEYRTNKGCIGELQGTIRELHGTIRELQGTIRELQGTV